MTHSYQRPALILLAATALSVGGFGASPALSATHKKPAPAAAAKDDSPKAANGKIVTVKSEPVTYVVKKGDTLEKIADRLDTSVDELMRANKLKKGAVLQPGDVIKGAAVPRKAYVVARGDTVFSIAKRFHVSVDVLREENDLSAKTSIHPGQQIRLPADYRAPSVEAADDQADDKPAKDEKPSKGAKGSADKASADKPAADESDDAAPAKGKGRKSKPPATSATDDTGAQAAADRANAGKVITREAKGETYTVRKGDTIAKVADKLDTDIGVLKRLNHLKGNSVRPGETLRGPSFAEHIYTAQAGDTLASIAARFSVSLASLRAENEFSKRVLSVRPGQKIYLPDDYRDRNAPVEVPSSGGGLRPPTRPQQPFNPDRGEPVLPSHPIPYSSTTGGATPQPIQPVQPQAGPSDAQISQMGKGRFQWPLPGAILSDFGPKPGGQRNDGINIQAEAGTAVRAAADGDVVYAGDQVPGFGNLVLIKHADGWVTAYGHLARVDVKAQQKVTQGQQIGQAGNTGGVPEPQLHFEVRYGTERARPVDPKLVLPPR